MAAQPSPRGDRFRRPDRGPAPRAILDRQSRSGHEHLAPAWGPGAGGRMAPTLITAECASGLPGTEADDWQRGLADFHQFYVAHADFVRRVVARLLGPGGDVDDAV